MRHQTVRPLSALVTIFVVVFVFGVAVGVAQSFAKADNPALAQADRLDSDGSEGVSLTSGTSHPID